MSRDARRVLERVGEVKVKHVSRGELMRTIADVDVLFVRVDTAVDSALLRRAKRLKIIATVSTGLNHIDLDAAKRRGIRVVSVHGMHAVSTAEHTMALILALCRNIPQAHESIRKGRWERHRFMGAELSGKVLGLVGMGRIGSLVAGYARAMGMRVIAYDPYITSRKARLMKSLGRLLRESDIVSIHATLTKETSGMMGTRELGMLKRGSYLVNTARAEIVDRRALLRALDSGRLAGAALDVFESEPVSGPNDPLVRYARGHKNLILTPHIGASTREAAHAGSLEVAEAIERALR